MKDKIQRIVDETNPKVIGPAIKKDPEIWKEIQNFSRDFPNDATISERVWAYLNDTSPYSPHTPRGEDSSQVAKDMAFVE